MARTCRGFVNRSAGHGEGFPNRVVREPDFDSKEPPWLNRTNGTERFHRVRVVGISERAEMMTTRPESLLEITRGGSRFIFLNAASGGAREIHRCRAYGSHFPVRILAAHAPPTTERIKAKRPPPSRCIRARTPFSR